MCGSAAALTVACSAGNGPLVAVRCIQCGIQSQVRASEADVIAAWNHRPDLKRRESEMLAEAKKQEARIAHLEHRLAVVGWSEFGSK